MSRTVYHDKTFTGAELPSTGFVNIEFEHCTFRSGGWMGADLTNARFTDCVFEQCDLSNAKTRGTGFRTVRFTNCKLLGMQFEQCNTFLLAVQFHGCRMDFTSFRSLVLKNTVLKGCALREADLSGANFSGSTFDDCDLSGVIFDATVLEKADLRSAFNFTIDPERTRLKGAHIAMHGLPGLLAKYDLVIS